MLELLKKKKREGKSDLSEPEKKAKLGVLDSLRSEAAGMMGDHLKGLKKVTVAAPSKEGLEKGLEMAKAITEDGEESEEESGPCPVCGEEGCICEPSEESSEESSEEMSEEQLDAKIQELLAKKEQLSKREI